MPSKVVLFWFRRDLRLHDNAGLYTALSSGLPVVPVFIFDTEILSELKDKDDRRVSFIYSALKKIQEELLPEKSTLDIRYGNPEEVLNQLAGDYDIKAVYTNRDYEPYATRRDETIENLLLAEGISFHTCKDQVIFEKDEVVKDDGTCYKVFPPYAKKWKSKLLKEAYQPFLSEKLIGNFLKQKQRPFPALSEMGFTANTHIPSIDSVNETIVKHYHTTRNIPSVSGTTRMGVHLRFGTVSIRKLVAVSTQLNETYVGELIWREYFMQLLWHYPRIVSEACKKEFDNIEWRNNEDDFQRWCDGKTGFPIVDAGIRELNETGFMHNRVRMIVGGFLVKDLLIDWRWGEAYFARKLLDYELAANNGNWQWVASCGYEASPYFRVFNPETQTKKFDPEFLYISKWIPELKSGSYPDPIVEHELARERCLLAYKKAVTKK